MATISKVKYDIKHVTKDEALKMVKAYHYSDTLPSINKAYVGFFLKDELVGLVTLGYGTRPKHTIQKLYPDLDTADYFEIGRMCMTEEMPRNSESQMLSQLIKWIRQNYPHIKILFTWADGMLGKAGYVYQAANFYYAGHIVGEFYIHNGFKIHPRQIKTLLGKRDDPRKTVRPSNEEMERLGIMHYKGKQFKYVYVVDKKYKNRSAVELTKNYPKEKDISWKVKRAGKWETTTKPPYVTDEIKEEGGRLKCQVQKNITRNTDEPPEKLKRGSVRT